MSGTERFHIYEFQKVLDAIVPGFFGAKHGPAVLQSVAKKEALAYSITPAYRNSVESSASGKFVAWVRERFIGRRQAYSR